MVEEDHQQEVSTGAGSEAGNLLAMSVNVSEIQNWF